MHRLLVGLAALLAFCAAVTLGPRVDATRAARARGTDLSMVPSPDQLRIASSGFHEAVADMLWVRTILVFGEYAGVPGKVAPKEWVRRMLDAIVTLDPGWRTPYFYGGVTLRILDDVDGSDALFRKGAEALPWDSFFPFSLGMNAYLYRKDYPEAARWIAEAATKDNAPAWYAATAAAMRRKGDDIDGALHYLREQYESTRNENVRKATRWQILRLEHDRLVDGWAAACRNFRATNGHPLARTEELARLGYALPTNPRGDDWVVGSDGVVRSAGAEAERHENLLGDELKLLK